MVAPTAVPWLGNHTTPSSTSNYNTRKFSFALENGSSIIVNDLSGISEHFNILKMFTTNNLW